MGCAVQAMGESNASKGPRRAIRCPAARLLVGGAALLAGSVAEAHAPAPVRASLAWLTALGLETFQVTVGLPRHARHGLRGWHDFAPCVQKVRHIVLTMRRWRGILQACNGCEDVREVR